jgi:copper transport protein
MRLLRLRRGGGDDVGPSGAIVARFSTVAASALVMVATTGTLLGWAEVRARRALTSTTYGWLLIAKVGIVAAVALVAGYNRYRLVPALQRAEKQGTSAWSHLRRTVRLEAVGLLVAIGLTAVLVNVNPARNAAGIGTIFTSTQALGDNSVNLVVDPDRAGRNSIHLYLLDPTGRPAPLAQELHLELSFPANDIGPIERTPFVAGPGHYQLDGSDLSISGTWQIVIVARVSKFEEQTATFAVTVNP